MLSSLNASLVLAVFWCVLYHHEWCALFFTFEFSRSEYFPFSRGSSQPRDWTPVSCTAEKAMAPHSSTLAWRIPGTAERGGLPSVGLHRVGHDWSDLAAAAAPALQVVSLLSVPPGKPLKKLDRWSYLQSRNRDTDVEKNYMDTKGEGEVGRIERLELTHTHYWYCV